jgi:hypothetical protein
MPWLTTKEDENNMKTDKTNSPSISKVAFWDVDFDKIDFDKNRRFVIDKVFNYGGFDDQLAIIKFYGVDIIKEEVQKISYFRKEVFAFLCGLFQLNPAGFKCYSKKQSNPTHWDY